MPWSPGNGLPFVVMPLSPIAGKLRPGAVFVCPGCGITHTACLRVLVVIALLVSEKAVDPLPLTSTYHVPGTR